jgi:hypothetical protein
MEKIFGSTIAKGNIAEILAAIRMTQATLPIHMAGMATHIHRIDRTAQTTLTDRGSACTGERQRA